MEKTVSRSGLTILPFLLIFSSALPQEGTKNRICQTNQCLFAAQNLKESMNVDVDPCDNFYLYACGNWPKVHKNQDDSPQNTFGLRSEGNDKEILDFLQQKNNHSEPESLQKARKLFSLCLNESAYTGRTIQIETILQTMGVRVTPFTNKMVDRFDLARALAWATKLAGVKIYFDLGVTPNPYNRAVNMIALRTPGMLEMDDNSMSSKRRPRRPRISKRSYENEQIHNREYIHEVIVKMCKNSNSMPCTSGNPYMSTPHDWIIDQIETLSHQFSKFMETSIHFPSSIIPDTYSLYQLQILSDSIADELNATIPKLNWTRYIQEMFKGLDNVTLDLSNTTEVPILIENLNFLTNTLKFMYSKRRDLWSIELEIWWQTISTILPYADLRMFNLKNSLVDDFDEYNPTRKHRCAAIAIASFGMAINHGYSTKEKYIDAKTKIAKILEHIRGSFEQMIKQASWMDEKTKQRALIKLKLLKSNIVYPNSTNGTSNLDNLYRDIEVTDNFFNTMDSKIQRKVKKSLNKLNQSNDLNEEYWTSPNIVNGFYDENRNTIIIPAGIVGGSIFTDSLRAWDYGAIGSILGHELTHAFDDIGRLYNEVGNIENWWQNETLNSYRDKAKCFVKAYANYSITFNGYTLQATNSTANSDEDISDNNAFKISLLAYRRSVSELGEEPFLPQFHNFTHEQLLTLAYANIFCENPTSDSVTTNQYQIHSPDGVRVNGVFKNSKEFSEIWKCPKDSKMNPSDKCSAW